MPTTPSKALALDVGAARIGLAVASLITRFPQPLTTLSNDENFIEQLKTIINNESVSELVVGLPRGLDGQETAQTLAVRAFAEELRQSIDLPLHWQDEALTSTKAEAELRARGKLYQKGDVDALAATYILEDFLNSQGSNQ